MIYYSLEIINSETVFDTLEFEDVMQYDADIDTFINIELENFESYYYWRVIAQGEHMPPVISSDTSMFILSDGLPPEVFDLGEPDDNEIRIETEVLFTWNRTTDPTPGDSVTYTLEIAENDTFYESRTFPVVEDTFLTVDEFDPDSSYYWRVYAEDRFHHRTYSSETRELYFDDESVFDSGEIPVAWELTAAYPNPFNASLTVVVAMPEKADLRVCLYDLLGREAALIHNNLSEPGYRQFTYNADSLASGIYFLQMSVPGKFKEMRKVVLIK
ncbi:T9SS type A sorting domain-containing protein [Calditrichota bacterium]